MPDLPSTGEIARIARSPVNLLNQLADRADAEDGAATTVAATPSRRRALTPDATGVHGSPAERPDPASTRATRVLRPVAQLADEHGSATRPSGHDAGRAPRRELGTASSIASGRPVALGVAAFVFYPHILHVLQDPYCARVRRAHCTFLRHQPARRADAAHQDRLLRRAALRVARSSSGSSGASSPRGSRRPSGATRSRSSRRRCCSSPGVSGRRTSASVTRIKFLQSIGGHVPGDRSTTRTST